MTTRVPLAFGPWTPLLRWAMLAALIALVPMIIWIDGPVAHIVATSPDWFRAPFKLVTDLGQGYPYLISSAFFAATCVLLSRHVSDERERQLLAWMVIAGAYVFAVTAVSGLLADILKVAFGRARPVLLDHDGPHAFFPLAFAARHQSFPSGHATTVMAFWLAIALLVRPVAGRFGALACLLVAGVLALSRIVVGAHFASDVVAGVLLGGFTSIALYRIVFESAIGAAWRSRFMRALCPLHGGPDGHSE